MLLLMSAALLFLETIVVARFLGATAMGLFVLIRAYPEAVQQVLDCRTHETMVRYLGEFVALDDRERAGAVVRLVWLIDIGAGIAGLGVVLATASLAARYVVRDPTSTWLIIVCALSQCVATLDSASGSVVRVFDRFGLAALVGIGRALVRFCAMVGVLAAGGGVASLIYVLVGVEAAHAVVSSGVAVALLRRRADFRILGSLRILGARRREILRFLLSTNITGTLKMGSEKFVLVIIGALGGTGVAAQYKVASQAGLSLMFVADPFYQVLYPPLSKLVALQQWDAIFGDLKKLQRTALTFILPLAGMMSLLMFPLLPAVFGGEFAPAVLPGIVAVWAAVPTVIFFWRRPLLLSFGEAGRLTRYQGVATALQLVIAVLLIQPLGALGAAVSLLVMHWVRAALEIRLVRRWRLQLKPGG